MRMERELQINTEPLAVVAAEKRAMWTRQADPRCEATTREGLRCLRNGSVEAHGAWLCRQHSGKP